MSIKVDREERPDVDAVYMEAVQAMTGSGGWPMSVFLTPDRRPFFGGTYFPPADRPGMPSFRTVLAALNDVWDNRRDEVEEQADELSARHRLPIADPPTPGDRLAVRHDRQCPGPRPICWPPPSTSWPHASIRCGAVSAAPPSSPNRHWWTWRCTSVGGNPTPRGGGPGRRQMAVTTLDAMAAGGIHDHLGGGFARYSTDAEWLVPHFEKMLYDQAGLLRAFLHGWQVTGQADYLDVVAGIIGYVGRDLTTTAGGVYSAEDADSEGVEGRFYVWSPDQISPPGDGECGRWRRRLGDGDGGDGVTPARRRRTGPATVTVTVTAVAVAATAAVAGAVIDWFGSAPGNFEGSNILRRPVGAPLRGDAPVESGRRLLLAARSERIRPGLDDKVLTEWNAMYGSAVAEAAAATGDANVGDDRSGHRVSSSATTWSGGRPVDDGAGSPRPGPPSWPMPPTTPGSSTASPGSGSSPAWPGGRNGPSTPPTPSSICSTTTGRWLLHHRP